MSGTAEKDVREIQRLAAAEFPNDPAMQQVHVARKLIAQEARSRGMTLLEYVASLRRHARPTPKAHAAR
ncbi:MAG: hypothetical protein NTX53_03610 [candidate division WOR-3 bacterium]|nr:hypothetical protein [candidate division WOR-3 bacterium]